MSCDVGEATERLENELCYDYNYELCSFSNPSFTPPTSQALHLIHLASRPCTNIFGEHTEIYIKASKDIDLEVNSEKTK